MASRPLLERPESGQAVVEYVAWTALVALLGLALAAGLVAAGIPQRVVAGMARAVGSGGSDDPPGVSPRTRALVLGAVHGSPDGHAATIADAERLLAAEIGAEAARGEIVRLALADVLATHGDRLTGVKEVMAYGAEGRPGDGASGIGPPSRSWWHGVEERRADQPGTAHVVTPAAADRLRALLHDRNTRDLRRDELLKLTVEAGLSFLVPWLRVPMFAAGLIEALRSEERLSTFPPGMRADDVVLCFPVRRLNAFPHDSDDRRWGTGPRALDIGRWHDVTHLVTVRSGVVVAEVMSDATTCA